MDPKMGFETEAEKRGLVVRDDEADFAALREAASGRKRREGRLRLVDSGRFSAVELEWLGKAGAEIYTSDRARPRAAEVVFLSAAARTGGAAVSFFHHGPLEPEEAGPALGLPDLREIAENGVYLALSASPRPRDPGTLVVLAAAARRGRSPLVYYHHGPLGPWLEDLAREGAWIHAVYPPPDGRGDDDSLRRTACAAEAAGGGLVVHVRKPADPNRLEDLSAAGARLVFERPPSDFRSRLRRLEERAARRPLDPRAGYLYPEFMR
ncbi:MAG: hypothetical protein FJY82_08470 [Candidatus Aminicenantes bacterium]|nr:hypothetical protein [Candidatus Aminicenantes bacterium]